MSTTTTTSQEPADLVKISQWQRKSSNHKTNFGGSVNSKPCSHAPLLKTTS